MAYTVVKYSNWLNELNFSNFTVMDLNFFFALCAKAKEQHTDVINFSFDELKKVTNYKFTGTQRFVHDLKRMNSKLLGINCMIDMEDKAGTIAQFNLFSTFLIHVKEQNLTVRVNSDFIFILNDLLSNYTKFDLPIFISLDSKFSKELFRHLRQWSSTGKVTYTVGDLRSMLGAPKSYTNSQFYNFILKTAVAELCECGAFRYLRCTINHEHKKGRPVSGYTFTWKRDARPASGDTTTTPSVSVGSLNGWAVAEEGLL